MRNCAGLLMFLQVLRIICIDDSYAKFISPVVQIYLAVFYGKLCLTAGCVTRTRRVWNQTKGVFLKKKSKIGFLNPKESENGFCVSLLNRSIHDLSDHGASKEQNNPLPEWILRFLWRTMIRKILDWSVSRKTHNPFSDSFRFKNPMLDFLKETHPI